MSRIWKTENLYYLTVFLAPTYLLRFNFFGFPTNLLEIFILATLVVTLLDNKTLFVSRIKQLPVPVILASCSIVLGVIISIFFNQNYEVGVGILKGWFLAPMFFAMGLFLVLDSEKKIIGIFYSHLFSTALVGAIALLYKISGHVTYDGRLSAFYSSPNYLAMYLATGAIVGYYLLFDRKLNFFLNICLFFLTILALYFTYSYGAWLSLIIALVSISIMNKTTVSSFVKKIAVVLFLVTSLFALQFGTDKFNSIASFSSRSSLASRLMIWNASLLMLKMHPLAGIGPGNFQSIYLALQSSFPPYLEWAVPQPHNVFLAFWLESGAIGLIGFILLIILMLGACKKQLAIKKTTNVVLLLSSFFVYVLVHGLVDTTYWKNDLAFIFWIFVCVALSLSKLKHQN